MATKIPQTPHTLLEQLLADADLDSLGRDDFLSRSYDLRAELAVFEDPMTDAAWYDHQIQFLSTHRYFTRAAQLLRDAQKQHNIAILRALLAAAE